MTEPKKRTADILIPHERVYQQRLLGDIPFHLKLAFKVIHHPLKNYNYYYYYHYHYHYYYYYCVSECSC